MSKQCTILIVWKAQAPVDEALPIMKRLQAYAQSSKRTVMVALPLGYLIELHKKGSLAPLKLGVKLMVSIAPGSFTAPIAGELLTESSADFVLIGSFSERTLQGTDQSALLDKIKAAVEKGVAPILCIGETWEQYESGQSESSLKEQLTDVAPYANAAGFELVYEAPWLHQNPHLTDVAALNTAYKKCHEVVNQALGKDKIKLFCGVPDELQDFDAFTEAVDADGYFFSKGTYFIPFTPDVVPPEPQLESVDDDSAEAVASVVGEALLAAAAESELDIESPQSNDSEDDENDLKRTSK